MNTSKASKRFPKSVTVNGRRYHLAEPYTDLGHGKSQGPLYRTQGPLYRTVPSEPGSLWLPDVAFVTGMRPRPTEMHRIRVPVETKAKKS